jgi:organic radical activating enzyme
MFKILSKEDALREPVLEMSITEPTDEIVLFGKKYRMYKDDWKHHVHLKCTNRCDAKCDFCIERPAYGDDEDALSFMHSAWCVIEELCDQGQFRTLSVTGGEPTCFSRLNEIIKLANHYKPTLFSINSNGACMDFIFPGTFEGWFNLSKHALNDQHIFKRNKNIDGLDIRRFKFAQPKAKVRIQCVLGVNGGLKTIDDIERFINHYADVADDFSFRSLIIDGKNEKVSDLFMQFRNQMFDAGCLVEQAIQDYYVYENYIWCNKPITMSWSNMDMLKKYNETHNNDNFLEEIIVHPDGMVTGSWNKKTLIIHNPNTPSKCSTCCWHNNGCRYKNGLCGGGC